MSGANEQALPAARKASPVRTVVQTATRRAVCYFGPNGDDPAVHRRINQLTRQGCDVTGFTFTRDPLYRPRRWRHVDLGSLRHGSYLRRLGVLAGAVARVLRHRRALRRADMIYARNLDNALLALLGRLVTGASAPLVYEVLDVRPPFLERSVRGRLMRWLERFVLRRSTLLVVSAPRFHSAYFGPVLGYDGPWHLLENKIADDSELSAAKRPAHVARARRPADRPASAPWRIGWFGYIDDLRSWHLLRHVAQALPERVHVHVRGIIYGGLDERAIRAEMDALDNVTFGGRYLNPEDLPAMMADVDMVWCDDLTAAGGNSDWLLPNILYDGGYFAKPLLSRRVSPAGAFIDRHGIGWVLDEPLEGSLESLLRTLDGAAYERRRRATEALPARAFVETDDVAAMLAAAREAQR